jgi:hypothetical protein
MRSDGGAGGDAFTSPKGWFISTWPAGGCGGSTVDRDSASARPALGSTGAVGISAGGCPLM